MGCRVRYSAVMGGGCVFRDTWDRLGGEANLGAPERQLDFEHACQRIRQVPLRSSAPCIAHGTQCHFPAAQVDVSGSPCLPWSRMSGGKRLGRAHTLSWGL